MCPSPSPWLWVCGTRRNIRVPSACKVILADSRSQGRSVDPDHPLNFEMMADDYAALLDAMHIDSAYVLG